MIIYKGLLPQREKISASEAIIYSTLVRNSLCSNRGVFDGAGKVDVRKVKKYINGNRSVTGCPFIKLSPCNYVKLGKSIGMSERNVYYVLKLLKEKKVLFYDTIYCPEWLIDDGYIKLAKDTNLKGWQLVFYSLLKERASHYGGRIDTFAYRLAELFKTTTNNVYALINILKSKGYVSRDEDGYLVVK